MLTLTNMPKPTKPPVRQKRAKSEVQEEFEEIRRGVEAARESADPKAEEAARLRAEGLKIEPGKGKKPPRVADFEKSLVTG